MSGPVKGIRFKIQDSRFKTQDSRFKTQDSRFKTQDSRLKTQDRRLKTQDRRLKTQDRRLKTQDSRLKTQDSANPKTLRTSRLSMLDSMSCVLHLVSCVFLCFASCVLLGCYGTEVVKIRVRVDSKVDMSKYNTLAVMDFIDIRDNSPTDQGKTLARMLRKQLVNSKEFHVLDERTMYLTLEEEIDKDKIEDPSVLVFISDQLEVDALIVGTFDFYQMNQAIPYIVERYSPSAGTYRPETRTYIQRVNHFSLHAKVVDGRTGETIFDYAPRPEEKPELRSVSWIPFSESGSDLTSLRSIAARPVAAFFLNLVPHYEYERSILAR
jgi:hypothetical protein